jgi:hypothetical protein
MSVKVWDTAIALPKDLDDTLQLISRLESLQEQPNPKFLALARALMVDPAFAGHWGSERILEDAENCSCAIWEPRLPAGDAMPAIRAVIQHAVALGLAAYRESRQVVFLPDGRTVTPAQKLLHDGDFEHYDSRLNARAKVCQALLNGFNEHFAPHGFSISNLDTTEINRFAALSFYDFRVAELSRPTRDGWQRLIVDINDQDADSEYFKCEISAGLRSEPVEKVFTQVFGDGIRKLDTFFFSPTIFLPDRANGFKVASDSLVSELPALIERLTMPVLDLARDLAGLDALMNDPSRFPFTYLPYPHAPQNLADHFVSFGRQSCLKTLIAAWLNRNSDFENRVMSLREFVKKRVDVSEEDLNRLVAYLRNIHS